MDIFIVGGSGAIGRRLVPMFVRQGHRVVAMTHMPVGAACLEAMGATPVIGDMSVYIYNEQSGASNHKARAALAWQPGTPSWRQGFSELYAPAGAT